MTELFRKLRTPGLEEVYNGPVTCILVALFRALGLRTAFAPNLRESGPTLGLGTTFPLFPGGSTFVPLGREGFGKILFRLTAFATSHTPHT